MHTSYHDISHNVNMLLINLDVNLTLYNKAALTEYYKRDINEINST